MITVMSMPFFILVREKDCVIRCQGETGDVQLTDIDDGDDNDRHDGAAREVKRAQVFTSSVFCLGHCFILPDISISPEKSRNLEFGYLFRVLKSHEFFVAILKLGI